MPRGAKAGSGLAQWQSPFGGRPPPRHPVGPGRAAEPFSNSRTRFFTSCKGIFTSTSCQGAFTQAQPANAVSGVLTEPFIQPILNPMEPAASLLRLTDITEAGRSLLGTVGYRRTRMADVAAAAGLSTGSIYTYVDSKEALLHTVLTSFFSPDYLHTTKIPITAPDLGVTLKEVRSGLAREAASPDLESALAADAPVDVRRELTAILDEMYSMVDRLWPVLAVLEKCAEDIVELRDFYFGRHRKGHLSRFALYVQRRAAEGKVLHASTNTELSAQLVVESLTWHAWHRLEGFDQPRFAGPESRRVVIEFAVNGLMATS